MKLMYLFTILAGVVWGIWPMFMHRSGLTGYTSATFFAGVALLLVLPFALATGGIEQVQELPMSRIMLGVIAGILGGLGLLFFNSVLANVSAKDVGKMFMIMLMFQLAMPVIWDMVQSGESSPRRIMGVIAAFSAAALLK